MCRSSSPGRGNFFLLRDDPRASAEKGFVVFTGHGQNDAGGHFHHETLGQLRHVNEPVLMHPDIDESTEVRDICDRGGRRSGRKRPLLADIRQTTNSVNPLCVILGSNPGPPATNPSDRQRRRSIRPPPRRRMKLDRWNDWNSPTAVPPKGPQARSAVTTPLQQLPS
jgi:hypothetical protein